MKQLLAVILLVVSSFGSTVIIDWNSPKQRIDGFGVAQAYANSVYNFAQRDQVMDLLFSQSGMNFSMLREDIADNLEPSKGIWDFSGEAAEVWVINQARQRGVQTVLVSCWSPPGWMKSNGKPTNGGTILPSHYQDFADYLAMFVLQYQRQFGIIIDAVSIANEPNVTATYDSTAWTGQNFHDFILNNLGPTFANDGIASEIIMPEQGYWKDTLATPTINDPAALQYVGILAAHGYFSNPPQPPLAGPANLPQWQTEDSPLGPISPDDWNDAIHWAIKVNGWMTSSNSNAWLSWWGAWDAHGRQGLTLIRLNYPAAGQFYPLKRLYTIGQFAKFIRPGYVRLAATSNPMTGVYTSAYKSTAGNFVLVVTNATGKPQSLDVSLNTSLQYLNSYTTTSNKNMAFAEVLTSVPSTFTLQVPASSVTTFVGQQ